jgi:hypothetical protein
MLMSDLAVEYGHELERLPGTPWSVRPGTGPGGRAALEVYAGQTIIDVMVERSLAPLMLRGARTAAWAGRPFAIAWGRQPADGARVRVAFDHGRLRPRVSPVDATDFAGWCWIATAPGRFSSVTVSDGSSCLRARLRTTRLRTTRLRTTRLRTTRLRTTRLRTTRLRTTRLRTTRPGEPG